MTTFPAHPFGTDITAANITEIMEKCRNWEDKYRLIIQLGKQLPNLDEQLKSESMPIPGCESKVWLVWRIENNLYHFAADSDARIVKGLLTIVIAAVEGKSREDLVAFNFEAYFEKMNLLDHLSPSRNNGVRAIVEQLQRI
ncbi:cysteine desulfurase, sulfur acceptor subunit CsdE [Enterovibrio norvegicus FF-33]|uniref:Cysteine desulfurase, sulfur acceptor subunit CsdE n=1 Tax=Enterovibrio norvegicus FF-454 TaxID=1185651 RepID=A0A1E5CA61_9GAMM|nr:cysteine desulfurase sulfur acceptor subunit CsdE [Enterovibrio norvegicus]OEE62414.1 cysteine desulfurase, sulfur acceptor subunit CsdE [Enterovibrio norvegicus FF-454]OEE68436.1 cysteine desulfurase, sulfur acceptor subunit CsdE [Enterovibrio norvegicus FF-33]OEE75096.1 cysteine desulfurase, sulfur acceptor subunit CsdE [Enterovibrio norvegicus FF-162]